MGNCILRGFGDVDDGMVKVVTSNGGVMELYPPLTAECITNGFPGHGLFLHSDLFSQPLLHTDDLVGGELYYLRPLNSPRAAALTSLAAPYRVSFGHHGFWRRQDVEVLAGGSGVWKVKLVISPAQLGEILSHESRTEALIESMRTVAKYRNGAGAASTASSDQWSLASSRKACYQSVG